MDSDEKKDSYLTRNTLLLRAVNQKDEHAWEEFVAYYRPFIRIILRYFKIQDTEIDDISQTVILNLWKNLEKFDAERSKFRTWLTAVIRNSIRTIKMKQSKDRDRDSRYFEEKSELSEEKMSEIFDREWRLYLTNVALENIKNSFSGKAIEVFLMSLENKSIEDISATLDLKENSVYRLRKRVQEQLAQEIKRLRMELEN